MALHAFLTGKDVFVNLPTGSGKSIIYQLVPLVSSRLEELSPNSGLGKSDAILVVVSPLISLMKDQVSYLTERSVRATHIGEHLEKKAIEDIVDGKFSIVYASPESLLANQRWRKMLLSNVYKNRLVGIAVDEAHCISQWGSSNSQTNVAFRKWFSRLSELRSLTKAPVMALTATATKSTRKTIYNVLRFDDGGFSYFGESPNKENITYVVQKIDKNTRPIEYFSLLIDELTEKGNCADRVIIYTQTIKQCQQIYSSLVGALGEKLFTEDSHNPRNVLVEMLHSCTDEENKKVILDSFSNPQGDIRVLVATIAFGMGVNCKGVHTTIHVGPSKNLESYVQESGRAGRDGAPSKAIILYHGLLLVSVQQDIKDYVKANTCRRVELMKPFGVDFPGRDGSYRPHHSCCDVCASKCTCVDDEVCTLKDTFHLPVREIKYVNVPSRERAVSKENRDELTRKLVVVRKQLMMKFISCEPHGKVPLFLHPEFVVGFSESQIKEVVDKCAYLFNKNDIDSHVEIWNSAHSKKILEVLNDVFGDIDSNNLEFDSNDPDPESDSDDENEWLQLVDESALMDVHYGDDAELSGFENLDSFNESAMDISGNAVGTAMPDLPDGVFERMSLT